jgi:transcriptional regulator with XRE-family HTH domain
MAKIKVRPYPGALAELLKSRDMTQTDAKSVSRIDRKTLAKIIRGEEVKLETLQTLANRLNVPTTFFDPPAGSSVDPVDGQLEDSKSSSLMLRKLDANDLPEMLRRTTRVKWELNNVHTIDEKTIPLLEQLEDAVSDLHAHINRGPQRSDEHYGLKPQLDKLKKIKLVASLLEGLAKHRLAVLGAEYLAWESTTETEYDDLGDLFTIFSYLSHPTALLSVEEPAQARRANVLRGNEPPRFAPDELTTIIHVNGTKLERDPATIQREEEINAANKAAGEKAWTELIAKKKAYRPRRGSGH